jgi:adenine-specific DNA-methyltransferase
MVKAFRDTWELGIHSYLSYLRDRLRLAKDLLNDSGSLFVQISDENIHHVRELMDEIFGGDNFIGLITFSTTRGFSTSTLSRAGDYLCWYGKNKQNVKFRPLFIEKDLVTGFGTAYCDFVELKDRTTRRLTKEESENASLLPHDSKLYSQSNLSAKGLPSSPQPFTYSGKTFYPNSGCHWKVKYPHGLDNLAKLGRIEVVGNTLKFKKYLSDFAFVEVNNFWAEQMSEQNKDYVVQTSTKVIQRCVLLSTDPGDLVLDITCGSGTTAFVSENWGRRWITCDTSRIALALAKQRLLTASFDYYELSRPEEGIGGGLVYETVPHITLKSIANAEPEGIEPLFDRPKIDTSKTRVAGPFTVESIPAPYVKNLDQEAYNSTLVDGSVTREGESLRQDQWRDQLQRTGVRGKGGSTLQFSRIEIQEGTRFIQAVGETKEKKPKRVLIVFGPEHSSLDARIVELAIEESRQLRPDILLFCAFQFDEEAAKDIDETSEKLLGFKLLKAQMNMDLQTDDLKKQRNTDQSFWLIGQPDVRVHKIDKGDDKGKIRIEVAGFDYYNPKTGAIDSGGPKNIAMWMLDTDYDSRSLFPRQIFFPMAGPKDGWYKLAKNLKAEIDEEKIEFFRGTVSLPFTPGVQIAIKIIDDRGIESLKIIKI